MRFDDPYMQLREFLRQFDRIRDLARSPFDDLNRTFREQRELFRSTSLQLTRALEQVETDKPLIAETQRLLESVALSPEPSLSAATRVREEIARSWEQYDQLFRAPELIDPAVLRLTVDPAQAALGSLRRHLDTAGHSVAAIQESLRKEILNAPTLAESLASIKLEEEIGSLYQRLEVPAIASDLSGFRAVVSQLHAGETWQKDTIRLLGEMAGKLELPPLRNAALQWSAMAQESLTAALGPPPLFEATLSTIASLTTGYPLEDFSQLVERWGSLVESEASHAEGHRLSPNIASYLLSLLLFLLSLLYQRAGTEEILGSIEELSKTEASTVTKLEEIEEAEDEEREEVALVRQALEKIVEAGQTEEDLHELGVAAENVRLRASASLDSEVVMIVPKGNTVEVVDEEGSWCKVRVFNFTTKRTVEGWVARELLLDWPDD